MQAAFPLQPLGARMVSAPLLLCHYHPHGLADPGRRSCCRIGPLIINRGACARTISRGRRSHLDDRSATREGNRPRRRRPMKMNSVRRNALYLSLLQGFNYLLPLLTVAYLVRVVGPTGYGRLALCQAYVQFFVVVVDYGFALSATRSIAQSSHHPAELERIFRAVTIARLLLALALFPVMLGIAVATPALSVNRSLCVAFYLSIIGNVFIPGWLYQGLQRMGTLTLITIAPRMLTTAAIFLLVRSDAQLILAAVLLSAAPLVSGAMALYHCRRWLGVTLGTTLPSAILGQFRAGWHVFLASASGAIYASSTTFVIGIIAPPAIVGNYAAAERLMKAAQNLLNPLTQAIYPHLARLFIDARDDALRLIGRLVGLVLLGYGLLALTCQIFAPIILLIIFGPRFEHSATLLRILSLYPLLAGLNVISGALYLVPQNLGEILSRSVTAPTFAHLTLILPIALLFSGDGVACLLLATELTILAFRLRRVRQKYPQDLFFILRGLVN